MSIFKEMQQRTVISWGKKTKVYADGKSILPNNEFKFEICNFWLNASSVWSATETAEGVVTTGVFFLKVFLSGRGAEMAINLSVTFLEVTLKVDILKASCKWH